MLSSLHFKQNWPHVTVIQLLPPQGSMVLAIYGGNSDNSYLQAAWLLFDFLAVSKCLGAGSSTDGIVMLCFYPWWCPDVTVILGTLDPAGWLFSQGHEAKQLDQGGVVKQWVEFLSTEVSVEVFQHFPNSQ